MAASIAIIKSNARARSISLPSRSHPSTTNVEEHLARIRASEATSTSSLSINCNKLSDLKELYECIDDLFQLPATQQNLSRCAENVIGASLRLLDMCSTTKDAFLQMRATVQDLESSLRRREADVSSKVGCYLICMKKVNKMVSKCFTSLKKLRINKNQYSLAMVSLLSKVEEVSITIFESLFSSICPLKATAKQNSWSFVAKLKQSKRVHCEGGSKEDMHMALEALYKQKSNKDTDILRIQEVQKCLIVLDTNMQKCEEDVDGLFRSSIKIRVSLLSVLNH